MTRQYQPKLARCHAIALTLAGLLLAPTLAVHAAPPFNDNLSNAISISAALPQTLTGSNIEATKESGEPNHAAGNTGGTSVWWYWTPNVSGTVNINTSGSTFDTLLAVYTGPSFPFFVRIASNDDFGGETQSRVIFPFTAGTTYIIAVDGRNGRSGSINLNLLQTAPVNDNFISATGLPDALPASVTGTNVLATKESGEPSHAGFSGGTSVWWNWTATQTRLVRVNTFNSTFDTLLAVYTGSAVNGLSVVAFNDQSGGGNQSAVEFQANAGTTYRIAVDGFTAESGAIRLNVDFAPPSNDNFASATFIPSALPRSVSGSNEAATREPGEPVHIFPEGRTVWWQWTPTESGLVAVDTNGSNFQTVLGLYTGNLVNSLTYISLYGEAFSGGPSTIRFFATAGTTYRIVVQGNTNDSGLITLNLSNVPPTVWTSTLSNPFPNGNGWIPLGQSGPLFTSSIGSRGFDGTNGALTATVGASSRGRIIGWLEDSANDMPYSSVGAGNFVRAKFSMFYSGPGDSADLALANRVPNFRLSLRTRGVVNTQLEINHNAQIAGSPSQLSFTRELGPSKNPALPSIYRVDLDPVDVPYLAATPSEGIQRGFETLVSGADYSFVSGVLGLTESSIGTYPILDQTIPPAKTWSTFGTAGSSDFDNPNVVLATLGASTANIVRYSTGPNAADYWNPAVVTISQPESGITIARSPSGITVNSTALATSRIGVADAAFIGGVFGDTPETRLRVEPGRLYALSFQLNHAGASDTTPFTRMNLRTIGFGYNATLELVGGRGLAATDARTFLSQVMPGAGNQVPGTNVGGTTYRLLFNSPMHPEIRNDVAGTLAQKFPQITALPGPGASTGGATARDLNLGFTVLDSLSIPSTTATDPAEVANNLTLNWIELRTYPQVVD